MVSRLESEYRIQRVNILSLFSKEGAVSVLGMGVYTVITEITEFFGNEYVLLLKYDPVAKAMAAVDIRKFVLVAQIDETRVDLDQLRAAVQSAKFNAWPIAASSSSARR